MNLGRIPGSTVIASEIERDGLRKWGRLIYVPRPSQARRPGRAFGYAKLAELADALDSGSSGVTLVGVQVPRFAFRYRWGRERPHTPMGALPPPRKRGPSPEVARPWGRVVERLCRSSEVA